MSLMNERTVSDRWTEVSGHVLTSTELSKLRGGRRLPWLLFALAVSGLVGLVVKGLEERDRLKAQVTDTLQDVNIARKQEAMATARVAELGDKLKAQEAVAVAVVDAAKKENDKLISDLKAQVGAQDGEVSTDANKIRVDLVDQILFKSGDATLSPRGKTVLQKVGGVLKDLEDKQILIGGHTDRRDIHNDRFPSNWELSAARAVNVVRFLTDEVGLDAHKVAAAAYSEFHPRARSLSKNRRIEILLTPVVQATRLKKS